MYHNVIGVFWSVRVDIGLHTRGESSLNNEKYGENSRGY